MRVGDIVVHQSFGPLTTDLGIVTELLNGDHCRVWYPAFNTFAVNWIKEFEIIASWNNLAHTLQADLAKFDGFKTWLDINVLKLRHNKL